MSLIRPLRSGKKKGRMSMIQIIETMLHKYALTVNDVRDRKVSLAQLRSVVRREGQDFDVFRALSQMRG